MVSEDFKFRYCMPQNYYIRKRKKILDDAMIFVKKTARTPNRSETEGLLEALHVARIFEIFYIFSLVRHI